MWLMMEGVMMLMQMCTLQWLMVERQGSDEEKLGKLT